jgi:hypothetical protein
MSKAATRKIPASSLRQQAVNNVETRGATLNTTTTTTTSNSRALVNIYDLSEQLLDKGDVGDDGILPRVGTTAEISRSSNKFVYVPRDKSTKWQ